MTTTSLEWLGIDDEQKSRVVAELEDWHRTMIQDFVTVIRGQRAEAMTPECQLGWWDVVCVEDDAHAECFHGTVEGFAAKLAEIGWAVENLERNQVMCPQCQQKPDEAEYAAQYRVGAGGLI